MEKKKKKNALGWWQKLSSGDPEKNIEIFNHMMTDHPSETSGTSSEAAMAEAIESIRENPETNLEAIKALELMDEKFKDKALRHRKWAKHVDGQEGEEYVYYPGYTEEEYEDEAERLQETPVDNDFVVGYKVGNDYVKYNTDTDDFVMYGKYKDGEKYTVSYYKVLDPDNYNKHRNRDRNKDINSFRDLTIGEALKELDD